MLRVVPGVGLEAPELGDVAAAPRSCNASEGHDPGGAGGQRQHGCHVTADTDRSSV